MTQGPRHVTINGERQDLTVTDIPTLLRTLDHDPEAGGIAVAVNGAVVPRSAWGTHELHDGDVLELVAATQGG